MDNYNSRTDNTTDAVMIMMAVSDYKNNPFISSLESKFPHKNGLMPVEDLIAMYSKENSVHKSIDDNYPRYWQGYLVILKPLLWICNYGTIRSLLTGIHLLLFGLIISELRNYKKLIIPYIAYFMFLNPVSLMLSMQFSWVTIISNAAILIILKNNHKLKNSKKLFLFFTLIGCLTSYMDFLTFPLITIAMPLLIYIGINNKEKNTKELLLESIEYSFCWCIGYGLNWFMKWLLANIITGNNVIEDGITAFLYRSSNVDANEKFSYFMTIYRNFGCSLQYSWLIIVIIEIISLINMLIHKKKINLKIMIPYLFVGIYPFMWAFVVANHTYSHCFFAYRIFGICIFAFLAYIYEMKYETVD